MKVMVLFQHRSLLDSDNSLLHHLSGHVKIASLKASISEKINRGLDMNLIKRTNNLYYYEEFKVVYADHLNDVINYY